MANVFRTQERSNLQPRMSCLQSASAGILFSAISLPLSTGLLWKHRRSTDGRSSRLSAWRALSNSRQSCHKTQWAIEDEREELIYRLLEEFKQRIGVALSDAHTHGFIAGARAALNAVEQKAESKT